jgi:hypothetical protein
MPRILVPPAPARLKVADCDHGRGLRMTVYISAQGYYTSVYCAREPCFPADPRESRNPKARASITARKGRR